MTKQVTFGADRLTAIGAAAVALSRIDMDRDAALVALVKAIGPDPSYENWTLAREASINAYMADSPKLSAEAAAKRWTRHVRAMRDYAEDQGLELGIPSKPKSATASAKAMRAKRAADPYKGLSASALKVEFDKAVSSGNVEKIASLAPAIQRAERAANSSEVKALRAGIRAAHKENLVSINKCTDVATLKAILAAYESAATPAAKPTKKKAAPRK